MKKSLVIIFTFSLWFIAFKSFTSGSGQGPSYTNAPGESNCTGCHSGTLNRGTFISKLNLSGNAMKDGYMIDTIYNLTLSFSQPNVSKYGFQLTVLDSTNSPVGTLTSISSRTQKKTAAISGKVREYIEQTSSGSSTTSSNFVDWTFQWKAPSAITGKVTFYVVLNATNSSSTEQGDSIYSKTFTIEPNALMPTAKATASDTVICASRAIDFKGSGTNGVTSYFWNFPGGTPSISNSQNPSIIYNTAGTFYAQFQTRNSYTTSKVDSIKVVVRESPSVTIFGDSIQFMCEEDSLELNASFSPNTSWIWSNGKKGQTAFVTDTGTYMVIATNDSGCSRKSPEVDVRFHGRPSVSLTGNLIRDSVCEGNPIQLTATNGFDSFYFFKNNSIIARSKSNIFSLKADTTSVYQAKVRDFKRCISLMSNGVNALVKPLLEKPVVKCTDQTPFSVRFTWEPVPSHSGVEISSDSGKTWEAPSTGTTGQYHEAIANPKSKIEIWVRALDVSPCFYGPPTIKVCETGSCNGLVYSIEYDSNVCSGDLVQIEVKNLWDKNYAISFENGSFFKDTIFSFNPIYTKGYLIEVVDSNNLGCPPDQFTLNIKVDLPSEVNFRSQKVSDVFCDGDTVRLFTNSGKDHYYFFVNNQLRLNTTDSFYYADNFNNGDSAWVIFNKGACEDTSEKKLITIIPLPDAQFTWERDTAEKAKVVVKFKAVNQNLPNYKFDFGDGSTSVLKNTSNDYSSFTGQEIKVTLTVNDNSDCVNSSSQTILVSTLGIPGVSYLPANVRIYPNPASNVLFIQFTDGIPAEKISFIEPGGQILHDVKPQNKLNAVDVSEFATGLYIMRLTNSDGRNYFYRMVKN
jgi:hypothetical protein